MKRLNLLIVLGILFAGGVYVFSHEAGGPNYGRRYGGYHMGRGYAYCYGDDESLGKELNLTKAQKEKIDKINEEYWGKYDKNMGDRDVMWKLHEAHDKAIANVLTLEQRKKVERLYTRDRFQGQRSRRGYARRRGCW